MLGFFVGFTVKLPMAPLHTWLPDAHTEAPTAGSVILAGLLLKTGAYGLMRFVIPLFPAASSRIAGVAMVLGTLGIIYGAALAYAQRDFKRMVAYTSVSHLGFVLLGIYAGNTLALQGAMMEIISHGISTGALFLIAGMLQERTHTRDLDRLGGLWATTPKMGGFTLLFALAALGLPGLGNFVAEFLVLLGTFQVSPVVASVASVGFVLSVIYALRLMQASMQGPNENGWSIPDLDPREIAILGSLSVIIIWLGLYPKPVFTTAAPPLRSIENARTVTRSIARSPLFAPLFRETTFPKQVPLPGVSGFEWSEGGTEIPKQGVSRRCGISGAVAKSVLDADDRGRSANPETPAIHSSGRLAFTGNAPGECARSREVRK